MVDPLLSVSQTCSQDESLSEKLALYGTSTSRDLAESTPIDLFVKHYCQPFIFGMPCPVYRRAQVVLLANDSIQYLSSAAKPSF